MEIIPELYLIILYYLIYLFQSKFEIVLTGEIDFAKCKRMNVKGYNNAGVWSEISTEIKQCHVEDGHSHITPRMIIDATGESGN